MIQFDQLLSASNVDCQLNVASKKKALQKLSEMLSASLNASERQEADAEGAASSDPSTIDDSAEELYSQMDIMDAFISRERLGSTGLGSGISLPHGRIAGLETPIASLITLAEGIDFDAPDSEPVDILFGLLVPEQCTEAHLQILAHMAEAFSDNELCSQIRACSSEQMDELHRLLQEWSTKRLQIE